MSKSIRVDYYVYILRSDSLSKFYTGYSSDVTKRLDMHNQGLSAFTSKGIPWRLVWTTSKMPKIDALKLERKIKKRGARRFLEGMSSE